MDDAGSEALRELAAQIEAKRPDCVEASEISNDELTLICPPTRLTGLIGFLKANRACQFSTLVDITAVDYPSRGARFDVVYHFLSMHQNHRIRVKTRLRAGEAIASITPLHLSAGWFEREVFDMFGIIFTGHDDLRRLLTDYGFRGHPLRKDFPTTGYTEVRYDEVEKRVVYEPVSLTQDYRQFDFMSPWEGAQYILPDAEKEGGKAGEKSSGKNGGAGG